MKGRKCGVLKKPLVILCLFTFLVTGCSSYNRSMYQVNKVVDTYTLKPLAQAYKAVTPDPVEKGVSNFFSNIGELGTVINSLLQGKFRNAAISSSRFVWNTTAGLGGIFDVATAMNLQSDPEDFGQTLRSWGVPAGPYIVLPLLGPSTLTDTIGLIGDYTVSPYNYYEWEDNAVRNGVTALRIVDARSKLLSATNLAENASTDEFTFVKNAYLQRREALVRDGEAKTEDDAVFDELFFDTDSKDAL